MVKLLLQVNFYFNFLVIFAELFYLRRVVVGGTASYIVSFANQNTTSNEIRNLAAGSYL